MIKKFAFADVDLLAAALIAEKFNTCRIFAFVGPLGVGKTTLIKALLKHCGVNECVDSPTFGYVRSYTNEKKQVFQHFDLYRIDSVENFIGLGFDEILYDKDVYCFIEWPHVITMLLEQPAVKKNVCVVTLSYDFFDQETRIIDWKCSIIKNY